MTYQDSDQQLNTDPRPRYQQVQQSLEQDIVTGLIPLGSQLPSVQELCQHFDTSRITINRALSDLERDGYISRQRGKLATVVRTAPLPGPSTLDLFQEKGDPDSSEIRWQLFNLQYMPPGLEISEKLGVNPADLVWLVERVGLVRGQVAASSSHHLKLPPEEHIEPRDVDPHKPVLAILQAKGVPLSHTELVVKAIAAGAEEKILLRIEEGDPVLEWRGTTYAQQGDPFPVAVLRQVHVGELTSWSMRVTPPPEG